jgi:hypothetical protein
MNIMSTYERRSMDMLKLFVQLEMISLIDTKENRSEKKKKKRNRVEHEVLLEREHQSRLIRCFRYKIVQ